MELRAGTIVRFRYQGVNTEDNQKEVLVLQPEWQGKMHALDLKRVTPAEREVLFELFDPRTYEPGHRSRYPLVEDVRRRMDPLEEVKNPMAFYTKFVKVFLRTAGDCYRTYFSARMNGVQIVRESGVRGRQYNPRPLFSKPLFKK